VYLTIEFDIAKKLAKMIHSAIKNKKCNRGGKQKKQKKNPEDSQNAAAVVNMNHTFFMPVDVERREIISRSKLSSLVVVI